MKSSKSKIKAPGNFWSSFWSLFGKFRTSIRKGFALILFAELVHVLDPFLFKVIVDKLTDFDRSAIWWIIGAILGLFVFRRFAGFISYFKDKLFFKIIGKAERDFLIDAQKKMVSLSLSYHEKEDTGNKIIKIDKGIWNILKLFESLYWEVVPVLIKLSIVCVVLFWTDYRLGLSFLFFAPSFIFLAFRANKSVNSVRKDRHRKYERAAGLMTQSIININTVKSFVREKWEIKRVTKIRDEILKLHVFEWRKILNSGLLRHTISDLGKTSILLIGTYLAWNNSITIGTLIFVFMLSNEAYNYLYRLSRFYDSLEEGSIAVQRYMKLMSETSEIVNKKNGLKPKKLIGKITFEDVNFAYEDAKDRALHGVKTSIAPGTTTALVGPSGGGKTTFARMIYRHYDPQKGCVKIDGIDLRKFDLFSFREFISIVPQEVEIFSTSVKDNVAYGNPKASLAEIKKAARIANADEFIRKLSEGYDTNVGERGIKLSGGQRQRIGIARAILANPKILIFDEATSSLDSQSEKLIQESMDKVSKGRTVIIIAHRLSTIRKADKIIVLEDGEIAEQGSHDELLTQRGGIYAKLLNLQKLGEVD